MISIVGSTGSIGENALKVIRRLGIRVSALVAYSNEKKLIEQAYEFKPEFIGLINDEAYLRAKAFLTKSFDDYKPVLIGGREALTFSCSLDAVNTILVSIVGIEGIFPVLDGLAHNKRIALANKECVVAGGELIQNALSLSKGEIIPVDSEHSAIFQCINSGLDFKNLSNKGHYIPRQSSSVEKLVLTASGGAFYNLSTADLKKITPKDIFHPNWSMGRRITLDSCTLINKAFEIIEARYLFNIENIDYCIHPNSVVHSFVKYRDGSYLALLSKPDMCGPIQYAFTYPLRMPLPDTELPLDTPLNFIKKREDIFFAPLLAQEVIKRANGFGAAFLGACEAASSLFEEGKIGFLDITRLVKHTFDSSNALQAKSIDDILLIHSDSKNRVRAIK